MRWYTTITSGLLPARVREGYGLSFSRTDAAVYDASLRAPRADVAADPAAACGAGPSTSRPCGAWRVGPRPIG